MYTIGKTNKVQFIITQKEIPTACIKIVRGTSSDNDVKIKLQFHLKKRTSKEHKRSCNENKEMTEQSDLNR